MRRVCQGFGLISALVAPVGAEAAERAVLVSTDGQLEKALRGALAPTRIEVLTVADEPPPRTEDVLAFARGVSGREAAAAVVWVAPAADGTSTLLVFDRDVDRVLQRPLEWAPPFGAEQAIAAARTVRTMLRALRVTPDVDAAPPAAVEAPRVRAEAARREGEPGEPRLESETRRERWTRLALESGAGVRLGGAGDATWRVSAGLGIGLGPMSLALVAGLTGAEPVEAAGFEGEYRDTTLALLARLPWRPGRFIVEPGLGAALHVNRLSGDLEMERVTRRRLDPAVRVQCFLGITAVGPVEVGVAVSGDGLLRRQRYLAGDDQVLDLPLVEGGLDVFVRVAGM